MKSTLKVLVTIIVIVLFIAIFAVIVGVNSDQGKGPGLIGLILFAGLIGALASIWKKKKE